MGRYNILYTTSFRYMKGGGQWSLYYLIKHLDKRCFHPVLLCPGEGELAERMRRVGADVVVLRIGRMRHMNPLVLLRLTSIFKRFNIDLIHTDSTTETLYGGLVARAMNIPLVWHIRVEQGSPLIDRVLTALASRLILVAGALARRFPWLKGGDKLAVIHNGVDLEEFDTLSLCPDRPTPPKDGSTIYIGCVGRIEERKGQAHLIEAIKGMEGVKLLLIGEGESHYMDHIERTVKASGMVDRVYMTGYCRNVPAILQEIDILAFTPLQGEGLSRVVLEGMAAGRPVITTDVGGNREAVVDGVTGYIVPPGDVAALRKRIEDLVRDPERRRAMGVAGRRRIEERFDVRKKVESIEGLYRELLPGGAGL